MRAPSATRTPFVVWPDEVSGREIVGGKAWALASAAAAGLPVPAWFVVTPGAFVTHGTDGNGQLSPEAALAVADAVRCLCSDGHTVAVRSSSRHEDGIELSMAGQFASRLHVAPSDVPEQAAYVWRSGFTPQVRAYTDQHRRSILSSTPAVLVQRMLAPETAGIAFSADPVSGRRGVAIVTATRGFGDRLAAGEVDGQTWSVDRERRVTHVAGLTSPPALDAPAVQAVARLARDAAAHFGRPQDIEWAFAGGRLWLLQSRPITSLADMADPDGRARLWDNSNIVESYSGVTTPMTFSFAVDVYEHVYRQFCRVLRVPDARVAREDEAFRNMLGLVRGRLYYNLGSWYRVLALFPGFSSNRRFMDQMMGVSDPSLEAVLPDRPAAGLVERTRTAGQAFTVAGALVVRHLTLPRAVRTFTDRLNAALVPPATPLALQRPDELVDHYRALRRDLLLAWDTPIVNDFLLMIFHGTLRAAAQRWCGDTDGRTLGLLLAGQTLASAEPAIRLRRMAGIASGDPDLLHHFESGRRIEAMAAARAHPEFDRELRAYLDAFGDRTLNELKLETRTLHDDPQPLLAAVAALARQGERANGDAAEREAALARDTVARRLARTPLRRVAFGWLLRHTRARIADRERLRLERTRLFARVRALVTELGRRFSELGVLDDPRDVFFLTMDEAMAFVEGRSACVSLRELCRVRRQEFAAYERDPAPASRFVTRGPVYAGNAFDLLTAAPALETRPDSGDRRGVGCCPGVVRGPVRVVSDPAAPIVPGSILVATHTDPGWILLFPSALGVIVERGSLLSHAAIVARELRVPTIVSVAGATRWLCDGDIVEMDGGAGTVRLLEAPEARREVATTAAHA